MATRKQHIKLIHIGAAKLFKDEDERRDWQQQHTGKRSCSKMTEAELKHLVKLLRDAKAIDPPKRAGRKPFNRSPYMKKIEAQLADMGLPWEYAERLARNITGGNGTGTEGRPGLERLEWVREERHFKAIIAALYNEQKKRQLLADIEYHLNALNLGESYVEQLIAGRKNASNWQRNIPLLNAVADDLRHKLAFENEPA